ncbi:MAG: L-2-hydroxyglutarate oxidase [Ignavibacteria bacterium]|nr:L-2-hydroxyglutarate oxidase [Ignavibacteria bacterium]
MNNFDIIIIGAGIIGLSTAYKLIEKDSSLKICLLEKENRVAGHQTGHNSGVIHSGIYYKPGSLKAINCITGYKMLLDFCNENDIRYDICGKIIVATEEKELEPLKVLYERGEANGLKGLENLSEKELIEYEPNVRGIKGIFVPQTGIVDYKIVSEKLSGLIRKKGVEIKFGEEVKDIKLSSGKVEIKTNKNNFNSGVLVSCAGLYSDKIALMLNDNIDFQIIPFRGEYYDLKPSAKGLIKNLIYPVPDPEFPFLGVHFTRRVDGTVEAGPNAVLAFKKEGYKKSDFNFNETRDTLTFKGFHKIALKYWKTGFYEMYRSLSKKEFVKSLQRLVPKITGEDLISGGSGVRAQACSKDGKLIDDFLFIENERVINVCNAPSPAATSSLSIGETIAEKVINNYLR